MILDKKNKILLVDDDKDMCESLADVITSGSDYQVDFATSGAETLDKIKENPFDLFILDYKMPKMNGIELLKHIKSSHPNSKVFILTAFISDELVKTATKEGAYEVLSKFTWPEDILKNIKKALG